MARNGGRFSGGVSNYEVRHPLRVGAKAGSRHRCPQCRKLCPDYDRRTRRWRHLDTCQLKTVLEADVPRVKCPEHGVVMVRVPWAEPESGFTALFEALVIDWLKEASIAAVSRQLKILSAKPTPFFRRCRRCNSLLYESTTWSKPWARNMIGQRWWRRTLAVG